MIRTARTTNAKVSRLYLIEKKGRGQGRIASKKKKGREKKERVASGKSFHHHVEVQTFFLLLKGVLEKEKWRTASIRGRFRTQYVTELEEWRDSPEEKEQETSGGIVG